MPKGLPWAKCMRKIKAQLRKEHPQMSAARVEAQAKRICGAIHARAEGLGKYAKKRRRTSRRS